ncbi:hypothetical protein TRFO_36868 [Tritrichomonas foetus]|uniref:Uncharacterized protein n=1 Tax=Tritrichomonas foetus TaxID=1144522 RepID=A0A1J4JCU9_9EUKA|nr:hypothetical protein TRFO_36868 [Tritrichomonas foetus]|eukprot:OHS97006.1 hypothetical protein TRFO_36868 [Tritrichomonas foetus]
MRISSKIILQNVILDFYSLIFLKKENIFLCNPAHALWLLNILILFTSDPQIMISHFIMSTLFRKSLSNVDQYIMSYKSALLLAVKSKNWIIADHIATIDKTLFALSEVAHKLDDHNCVISMDNNNRYKIEKSLSWNTKFDYNGNDEILIKLFQNRNHDIIEIQKRKIVKEEDINKLCKDEIEKLKKYQHLYKYIKMISTISSGNFDHNSALTIVEVINTNIQKALKYANLFEFDLFPIILLNEKDIPITKDIISDLHPKIHWNVWRYLLIRKIWI